MLENRQRLRIAGLLAAVLLVIVASGCAWTTQAGPLQTESRTIELGGAEAVAVDLKMGAGELTLSGGAAALAEADFTYNVADWRPTIDYVVAGDEGELHIEQPRAENVGLESYRYEWDVRLNDQVPMALDVALGAGESEIDVSTLSLTRLGLEMGVGAVELDLTGDRAQDVEVTIRGGVGEATVLLPDDVGVEARVGGGLGDVDASGMTRQGGVYVNEAYGGSEATITLDIEGGIGGVNLQVVD
jgi:hypothetical protein